MSGDRPPNSRLAKLNQLDVYDLIGKRLVDQTWRFIENALVTAMHAEGDMLRGRVRDKPGLPATVVRLRLPDGHPALAFTLEVVEPVAADGTGIFTLFEAALLQNWAYSRQGMRTAVAISESGIRELDLTSQTASALAPAWLDAFDQVAPDALWQGMRGPGANLPTLVSYQRVVEVRRLAKRLGIRSSKESKETLLPQIIPELGKTETMQAAIDSLSAYQRAVLALFILRDSGMPPYALNEAAIQLKLVPAASDDQMPRLAPEISAALHTLKTAALILPDDPSHEYAARHEVPLEVAACYRPTISNLLPTATTPAEAVHLTPTPPELLATLRGLVMALRASSWQAPAPPPRSGIEQTLTMLSAWHNDAQEVEQVYAQKKDPWRWQYDQNITLTICPPPPLLNDADITTLADATGSTPTVIRFLLRLLEALGVLSARPPQLHLSVRIDSLLLRPVHEQRRLLATTWAYMTNWSELHDLDALAIRRNVLATSVLRPDQLYAELAAVRRFLLRMVRMLDPERWYRVDELIALVKAVHRRLVFEQRTLQSTVEHSVSWWLNRKNGRRLDPLKDRDWQDGEAVLIHYLLTGPLCWLGMLEAGGSRAEYIRLTPVGAYLLGLREQVERHASGQTLSICVDPAMAQITVRLALADATPTVLQTLEQVTQAAGIENGTLVYHMTPRTLRDGLLRGQTVADLQEFVRQHAQPPLPDTIPTLLEQWGDSFGHAHIYTNMALIELADDLLLPELLRATRLQGVVLEQLSPRLLLVDPSAATALFDELAAKGYTPRRISTS